MTQYMTQVLQVYQNALSLGNLYYFLILDIDCTKETGQYKGGA